MEHKHHAKSSLMFIGSEEILDELEPEPVEQIKVLQLRNFRHIKRKMGLKISKSLKQTLRQTLFKLGTIQ